MHFSESDLTSDTAMAAVAALRQDLLGLAKRLRRVDREDAGSLTELMALLVIERGAGLATPSEVAQSLYLKSSNVAPLLKALEAKGLMARSADPHDKRKVRLSLLPEGQAWVARTRQERNEWFLTVLQSCCSPSERQSLLAMGPLLRRLALWDAPTHAGRCGV